MRELSIRILLATYQGETYLPQLLDSLLAQDAPGLQIVASDDGSSDATPAILDRYAKAYPERLLHHRSGRRFGSSQDHFLYLLRHFGDAPYVIFCDQDDVWHPDKVSRTLSAMQQLCPDPSIPALVHTDLRVVDRSLQEIAPSFLHFSALDGSRVALHQLLVQNVVTGCTMMVNRALTQLFCSVPEPDAVLMHDWYLALLAAACGRVGFLDEATIDYRQHGGNVVGAKNARSPAYLLKRLRSHDAKDAFRRTTNQAASLLTSYGNFMPAEARSVCQAFQALPQQSKLSRLRCYHRCHFWKQNLTRRIGQLIWW